jgi:GAF domain-containing protein
MVPLLVDDVAPFEDWSAAARGALAVLHSTVGLDLWLLTHVEGNDQVVLHAHPWEAVPAGTTVPWDRSFCRKMVAGTGPRVSTVTAATPAYASVRSGHTESIAAYLGVPIVTRSGELFGTLCGVSERAQPRSFVRHLPTVELVARLLSSLLPEDPSSLLPLPADRLRLFAQADGDGPGESVGMTTPTPDPQPRDIALEQETPEQAAALEAASAPEPAPEGSTDR